MVLSGIFRIGQTIFRYRKYIYRTLVAQDRIVDKALRYGRVSKATRYGIRHGLTVGSIIGSFISNPMDLNGDNGFSPKPEFPKTGTQYKTRRRFTRRTNTRYKRKNADHACSRCTCVS